MLKTSGSDGIYVDKKPVQRLYIVISREVLAGPGDDLLDLRVCRVFHQQPAAFGANLAVALLPLFQEIRLARIDDVVQRSDSVVMVKLVDHFRHTSVVSEVAAFPISVRELGSTLDELTGFEEKLDAKLNVG